MNGAHESLTQTVQPHVIIVGGGFGGLAAAKALLESGRAHLSGFLAWLTWAAIHTMFLPQAGNRLMVFTQWAWSYLTKQGGARLILEPCADPAKPSETKP